MGSDDLFKRRKKRGDVKRKEEVREQKEICVICEGNTEKSYLESIYPKKFHFIQHNHLPHIDSEICNRKDSVKHIFVFLDGDIQQEASLNQFIRKYKNESNVTIIVNDPCFERWFILHFEGNDTFFVGNGQTKTSGKECVGYLKNILKKQKHDYKKGILDQKFLNLLKSKHQQALKNLGIVAKSWRYPTMQVFFDKMKTL